MKYVCFLILLCFIPAVSAYPQFCLLIPFFVEIHRTFVLGKEKDAFFRYGKP